MPRTKDHAASVTAAVDDLLKAVTALVGSVHATVSSSSAVRSSAAQVGRSAVEVKAVASAKSAKLRKALKAYWKRMKGAAREQRIAKMLKGRGLKPKKAPKPTSKK